MVVQGGMLNYNYHLNLMGDLIYHSISFKDHNYMSWLRLQAGYNIDNLQRTISCLEINNYKCTCSRLKKPDISAVCFEALNSLFDMEGWGDFVGEESGLRTGDITGAPENT